MTRLAILADIHGNWPALEAVLADMAALGIEQGVVAGDAVNRGPFSGEVLAAIERLRLAGDPGQQREQPAGLQRAGDARRADQ